MSVRINKFLADYGIASRRTIDSLIVSGRVTVNGVRLEQLGYMVSDGDSIAIDGKRVEIKKKQACVYILFNKPSVWKMGKWGQPPFIQCMVY